MTTGKIMRNNLLPYTMATTITIILLYYSALLYYIILYYHTIIYYYCKQQLIRPRPLFNVECATLQISETGPRVEHNTP